MKQTISLMILAVLSMLLISCVSNTIPASEKEGSEVGQINQNENSTYDAVESLDDDLVSIETNLENLEPVYTLDWKIDENEVVAYKTAMNLVDRPDLSFSFNFDQLFTENHLPKEIEEHLSGIQLPETFSMISVLEKNQRENISVKMIVDEVDTPHVDTDDPVGQGVNRLMNEMEGTVQLRGELTPEGAISSFYLEQNQRNLLAMFFELPVGPVRVNDSWHIDVNCISMGNGFIAENAERVNKVQFSEIITNPDGSSVAVLDYVIAETVAGEFQSPFSDEAVPTTMTCTFLGQGQFLIDEGRWEQFTGEFSIKSTGLMDSDAVQHFALTTLADVPKEYIGIK